MPSEQSRLRRAAIVFITIILISSMVFTGVTVPSGAQEDPDPPVPPAAYYGEVTIDGEPAPPGTTIQAEIDDETRGSITVTESGEYGSPTAGRQNLIVDGNNSDNGNPVSFVIITSNGERRPVSTTNPTNVTWTSGNVEQVDLTVSRDNDSSETGFAEVTSLDPRRATIAQNTSLNIDVTVTNTGGEEINQTVEFRIGAQNSTTQQVSLKPDENETLTFGNVEPPEVELPLGESESVGYSVSTVDDIANGTVVITNPSPFDGGSGTIDDPFQITTAEQFNLIRLAPGAHYELDGDIDLTNLDGQFIPIKGPFTASLDGNGYTISGLNVTAPTAATREVGLFNETKGAVIADLTIAEPRVAVNDEQTNESIGILAGKAHETTVTDVAVTNGTVSVGNPKKLASVGGLIGGSVKRVSIVNSTVTTLVQIDVATGAVSGVGGIAGRSSGEFALVNTTAMTTLTVTGETNITDIGGIIGDTEALSVNGSEVSTDTTAVIQPTDDSPEDTATDSELRRIGGIAGSVNRNISVVDTSIDGNVRIGATESNIIAIGGVAGTGGERIVTENVINRVNTTVGSGTSFVRAVGGWIGDASDATIDISASYSQSATTVGASGVVVNVGHFAGILRTDGTMQSISIDGVINVAGPAVSFVAQRIDDIPLEFKGTNRPILVENIGGVAGTASQPENSEASAETADQSADNASGGAVALSTTDPRGLNVNRTNILVDKDIRASDSSNIGRFSGRLLGRLDLSDVFLGGVITPIEELDASGIVNEVEGGRITLTNTTFDGKRGPADPGPIDSGEPSGDPGDIPPGLGGGGDDDGGVNDGDNYPDLPDAPDNDGSPRFSGDLSAVDGSITLTDDAVEEVGAGEVTVTVSVDRGTGDELKLDLLNTEGSYEVSAPSGNRTLTATVEADRTTATFNITPTSQNIIVDSDDVSGTNFDVIVADAEFDGFEVRADELSVFQDLRFESRLTPEADVLVDRVEWDFGDGTQAQGEVVSHAYDEPGEYEVSITLFGADGDKFTATDTVTIEPLPEVAIADVDLVADGKTIGPADQVAIPNPEDVPIGYEYQVTVGDARSIDDFNATVDGEQISDSNISRNGNTFQVELAPSDLSQGTTVAFEARGTPGEELVDNDSAVQTERDSETVVVRTFDLPPFVLAQTTPEAFDFDDTSIVVEVNSIVPPGGDIVFQVPNEYGDIKTGNFTPPLVEDDQETGANVTLRVEIQPVQRYANVTTGGSVEHEVSIARVSGEVTGTGHISLEEPRFDGATISGEGTAEAEIPPGGVPIFPPSPEPSFVPAFSLTVGLDGTLGAPDEPGVESLDVSAGNGTIGLGAQQAVAADFIIGGAATGFEQELDAVAPADTFRPIDLTGRFFLFAEAGVGPFGQSVRIPDQEDAALLDATVLDNAGDTTRIAAVTDRPAIKSAESSDVEIADVGGDTPPQVTASATPGAVSDGNPASVSTEEGASSASTPTIARITENVVDDESPAVTTTTNDNDTLVVWSRQRPDKPAADGRDIVVGRLNREHDASIKNITNNSRSEFEPVIAGPSADDHLIAAVQLSEQFDGRDVTELNEVFNSTDIVVTEPDANGWAEPTVLTRSDENTVTGGPTLAYNGEQWLLAWESRTDGFQSQAEDHEVNYVWYDGSEFSEIKTISAARAPVVTAASVDAADPDGFHLAYVDLGPGTVSDPAADRRHGNVTVETFTGDRSVIQTKQYPVTEFKDLDVTGNSIGWIDSDTSTSVSLATRQSTETGFGNVTSPPINPPSTSQSVELTVSNETLVTTVRGTAPETGISRTSYAAQVNGTWLPTRVYADGAANNLTYAQAASAPTSDGFVTAFSGKELLTNQRYDIFAFKETFTPDLNVSVAPGPDTDLTSLSVNETTTLKYTVTNDGPAEASATEVAATADGTPVVTSDVPALAPGENTTGTVNITVPDTGSLTLSADPSDSIADLNRSNNAQSVQLVRGKAVVNNITITDSNSTRTVSTVITNPTNVATDAVRVRFENGPTLNDTTVVNELAPGETQRIEFVASPAAFDTAYPIVTETRPADAPQTAPAVDSKAISFAPNIRFSADAITFYESDGELIADIVVENRGPISTTGTLAGVAVSESDASLRGSLDTKAGSPTPGVITANATADQIQSTTATISSSGSTSSTQFERITLPLGDRDAINVTTDVVGVTLTANGVTQDAAVVPITDGTIELAQADSIPPSGKINASATSITLGETVELRAQDLTSPTSEIESFEWDVGNGSTVTNQPTISVTPTELGETEVGLVIRDNDNLTERVSTTITVSPDNNSAVFAVTELTPLRPDVTRGSNETVAVNAVVTNTGEKEAEQTVELRIGSQPVNATQLSLGPSESETVQIALPPVQRQAGDYTYGIFSEDANQTGILTVSPAQNGGGGGSSGGGGGDTTTTATNTTTTATTTTATTTTVTTTTIRDVPTSTAATETTGSDAPGFGPIITIVGILAGALLALRRQD